MLPIREPVKRARLNFAIACAAASGALPPECITAFYRGCRARREPIAPFERVSQEPLLEIAVTDSTVELKCADYQVTSASMGHTRAGAMFRCTVSPVSDEMIEQIAAAARAKEMIRLVFPKERLLLERVDVKRIDAGTVRIAGRIVSQ